MNKGFFLKIKRNISQKQNKMAYTSFFFFKNSSANTRVRDSNFNIGFLERQDGLV